MADQQMRKVTFNIPDELYAEYKKVLIDLRTTPTADVRRHMAEVVEKAKKKEE